MMGLKVNHVNKRGSRRSVPPERCQNGDFAGKAICNDEVTPNDHNDSVLHLSRKSFMVSALHVANQLMIQMV